MTRTTIDVRAITSLAVLKVNWDELRRDYLENYMPFLAEALRASENDRVSLPDVTERLRALIGFDVPQGVVRTLLGRAKKSGHVRLANGVFHIDRAAIPSEPLARKEGDLRRDCESLVLKLAAFASERFGETWSGMEAERALLGVIDSFAAPLLTAARSGERPLPPSGEEGSARYIAAAFIEDAYDRDTDAYRYLETVATGAVLASAVYYEDANAVKESASELTVYLDTPLVLDGLGVNGEHYKTPVVELLDLMDDQGIRAYMLRRTYDETMGVLDAHGGRTGRQRLDVGRGPIRGTMSPSDALLLADQLEDHLRKLGIRVVDQPSYDERWGINESALDDRLQKAIDYVNPGARTHDTQALATVYALRRGGRPARLEKAGSIFVTTNRKLAWTAQDFFREEHYRETQRAPVCIVADEFATRLWLKTPNDAPDLPARQLLARAYAALQPSDAIIEKYLEEAKRLRDAGTITPSDYLALRSSDDLLRRMTEATRNDPEAFVEGSFEQLHAREIETVKRAASERADRETAARRAAERKVGELQESLADAEAAVSTEQSKRERSDADRERAEREAAEATREAERLLQRERDRRQLADRWARNTGRTVRYGVWIGLGAALVTAVMWSKPTLPTAIQNLGGIGAALGLAIIAALLLNAISDAGGLAAAPGRWAEEGTRRFLYLVLDIDGTGAGDDQGGALEISGQFESYPHEADDSAGGPMQ